MSQPLKMNKCICKDLVTQNGATKKSCAEVERTTENTRKSAKSLESEIKANVMFQCYFSHNL